MDNSHFSRQRPSWWPENEAWPPAGSYWRRRRGHFVRRFGCIFFFLVFAAFAVLALLMGLAISLAERAPLGTSLVAWGLILLGGVVCVLMFAFLFWAGRSFRRASRPLGELIEAADRVAGGDYSARVSEQGPRELRSVAHAFNTMATRLQENDAQRRSLLADVTHELRTPLTVIQGNLEGMLDGVYAADEANLKSTLEETQVLKRLVEDLRTLSLAESGALDLKLEPTDLATLIHETAAGFRSQANTQEVKLEVDVPQDVPLVNLDPARIRQVLINLLANALHYTPQGGTIRVGLRMLNGGEPQAEISVQDNGPGIQPEDLPHVFDRFYKTRDSGGMGLGLAIAKNLVEAHHGKISASSQDGQGTLVKVTLPVAG